MKNMCYPYGALICLIALTGCANLQERMATRSAGTAASMPPPPPPISLGSMGQPGFADSSAPPPPPVAPALSITQPPPLDNDLSNAAPAKSSSSKTTVKADKLYNLSSKPSTKVAASAPKRNSTLSRLASKAAPAKLDLEESAAPAKQAPAVADKKPEPAASATPAEEVAARPASDPDSLPSPAAAAPAAPAEEDTSFLATPVRKGEGKEKSPQSNLAPRTTPRETHKNTKPGIVPVSNPVDDIEDFDGRSYS